MESVLILGAGLMQKPAILSAKSNGYKTFVIDADKNAICVPLADEFCQIDLKAKDEILEYAKQLKQTQNLKAVFTAGTDFSASVSYVCENLNFNAHSYQAALNASVKNQMRTCFDNAQVPSPKFISVNQKDLQDNSFVQKCSEIAYPFVVKPVDNMGARGCRLVRNEKELFPALKIAVESSRTSVAIVEEYMEGREFSIDALVYNGTFTITGFAERHIYFPPYFIEMGHTMPVQLSKKDREQLISVFALGAKSLGLTAGAAKADIKLTKNGPMIGEIAARLSGGYMSGWTYPYSSDLNLTEQALLIALNKEPQKLIQNRVSIDYNPSELCKNMQKPYELFEVPSVRTSAERAWISIPGVIQNIQGYEIAKEISDINDVLPRNLDVGSSIDFPRNNVQKCGNVISVNADYQKSVESAQKAISSIILTLKPNQTSTDDFLQGKTCVEEEGFPPSAYFDLTKEQEDLLNGEILANQKIQDCIPEFLKDKLQQSDWNARSLIQTIQLFDKLRPNHPQLQAKNFWKALLKGGIQGALYINDSTKVL